MNNNSPKKNPNKWLVLISIPIQMGIVIFLFSKGGSWLDEQYPNQHALFLKIMTLVGVAISFYYLNRQLKDLNS